MLGGGENSGPPAPNLMSFHSAQEGKSHVLSCYGDVPRAWQGEWIHEWVVKCHSGLWDQLLQSMAPAPPRKRRPRRTSQRRYILFAQCCWVLDSSPISRSHIDLSPVWVQEMRREYLRVKGFPFCLVYGPQPANVLLGSSSKAPGLSQPQSPDYHSLKLLVSICSPERKLHPPELKPARI